MIRSCEFCGHESERVRVYENLMQVCPECREADDVHVGWDLMHVEVANRVYPGDGAWLDTPTHVRYRTARLGAINSELYSLGLEPVCTFHFEGIDVHDPRMDETDHRFVDPRTYYGEAYLQSEFARDLSL